MMTQLLTFTIKLAIFGCFLAYVGSCTYRHVIEDQLAIQKMTERCK